MPRLSSSQSARPIWLQVTLLSMWLALLLLVWLQWRWSNDLGDAYQEKLQGSLAVGARLMAGSLREDLEQLCRSAEGILPDNPGALPDSPLPYELLEVDATLTNWRRYNALESRWTASEMPKGWAPLRDELLASADDLSTATSRRWFQRPWLASSAGPVVFRAWAADVDPDSAYRLPSSRDIAGFLLLALDAEQLRQRYWPAKYERSFAASLSQVHAEVQMGALLRVPLGGGPVAGNRAQHLDLLAPDLGSSRLRSAGDSSNWQVHAVHRPGALDAAVASLRLRNLITGGAVCLVLLAGTILLSQAASRARALARMQADFVAGFSHELRTPVTAIQTLAANLEDGLVDEPAQVARYGTLIHEQSRRLRARIEDILGFAAGRPSQLRVEPVELAAVIDAALREEANLLAGFTIEKAIDPDLPLAQADAGLLRSCLTNLLANAAKYARQGAWLRIAVSPRQPGWISVTITDRGPGIAPEDQARLFEPFFRGKAARDSQAPGSGLGLHLVRTRIEAMQGRILLHSSPGQGATFELLLRTGSA